MPRAALTASQTRLRMTDDESSLAVTRRDALATVAASSSRAAGRLVDGLDGDPNCEVVHVLVVAGRVAEVRGEVLAQTRQVGEGGVAHLAAVHGPVHHRVHAPVST